MKSIKHKILLGFSVILLLMLGLSSYVIINIMQFNKEVERVAAKEMEILIADEELKFDMSQRIALARGYVLFGEPSYKELFSTYTERAKEFEDKVLSLSASDKAKPYIDKSKEWTTLIEEEVFAEYDKGNKEAALRVLENEGTTIGREIMEGYQELVLERKDIITENSQTLIKNGVQLEIITTIITVLCIVLAIVIAIVISNIIIKPITLVVNRVKSIAGGDLTGNLIQSKSKDEIGVLTNSINDMVVSLRDLVQQVQDTSNQVVATSEELTASAEQNSKAGEEITSNIQQLAIGSENQAKQVENAADVINEMVASVEQVSGNTQIVTATVEQAAVKSNEGRKAINTSINQMNAISETVQSLGHVIKGLGEQSKEIGDIVSVITAIADQTNLLALNAAIEAARAGEHGKGFAVVADEVRKLAEESAKSSNKIVLLVSRIQDETTKAIGSMESTIKEVDNGIGTAKTAGDSFIQIKEAIEDVANQVNEVSIAMSEMNAGTENILRSMTVVSNISDESAAGAQNVSAASEEQLASMEEITASATNLSEMAEDLMSKVSKFKL